MSFSKSKLDADLDRAFIELDQEGFWSKFDAVAFPMGKKNNPKQVKVAASLQPGVGSVSFNVKE